MKIYENSGLKVTQLLTKGSDFFPILTFKIEIQGQKTRIDKVDSSKDLQKFMYLSKRNTSLAEAYYNMIV